MSRLRRFTAAAVLSTMVAGFTLALSTPVAASDDRGAASTAVVCRALSAAEAALACLPDGRLKTYLAGQIDAAQAKNHCP